MLIGNKKVNNIINKFLNTPTTTEDNSLLLKEVYPMQNFHYIDDKPGGQRSKGKISYLLDENKNFLEVWLEKYPIIHEDEASTLSSVDKQILLDSYIAIEYIAGNLYRNPNLLGENAPRILLISNKNISKITGIASKLFHPYANLKDVMNEQYINKKYNKLNLPINKDIIVNTNNVNINNSEETILQTFSYDYSFIHDIFISAFIVADGDVHGHNIGAHLDLEKSTAQLKKIDAGEALKFKEFDIIYKIKNDWSNAFKGKTHFGYDAQLFQSEAFLKKLEFTISNKNKIIQSLEEDVKKHVDNYYQSLKEISKYPTINLKIHDHGLRSLKDLKAYIIDGIKGNFIQIEQLYKILKFEKYFKYMTNLDKFANKLSDIEIAYKEQMTHEIVNEILGPNGNKKIEWFSDRNNKVLPSSQRFTILEYITKFYPERVEILHKFKTENSPKLADATRRHSLNDEMRKAIETDPELKKAQRVVSYHEPTSDSIIVTNTIPNNPNNKTEKSSYRKSFNSKLLNTKKVVSLNQIFEDKENSPRPNTPSSTINDKSFRAENNNDSIINNKSKNTTTHPQLKNNKTSARSVEDKKKARRKTDSIIKAK